MITHELVDEALLERVLDGARASPRRRKNYNFHRREGDPCQRLLNAVLPDAYIRPHRHLDPNKEELLVALRGRLGLVFFDESGTVTGKVVIEAGGSNIAVNIPAGQFHTGVALQPCVVFEAKAGPYAPHLPSELAAFAPEESSPQAASYFAGLKRLFA